MMHGPINIRFITGLFNEAVNSSRYVAKTNRINSKNNFKQHGRKQTLSVKDYGKRK